MGYTIGDGMAAVALIGGIVAYIFVKHRSRQHRLEIIHKERMAAMEKGIPLPELPPDPDHDPRHRRGGDPDHVIPILGIALLTLSAGAMTVLFWNLNADSHAMWIAPLPFTFLGVGFLAFHFFHNRQDGGGSDQH